MTMSATHSTMKSPHPSALKWPALHYAFKKLRSEFLHLLSFSFAMNVLVLSVPIFMIQVFDRVLTSQSMETLWVLAIGTIVALLVMTALDVIRGHILVRASNKLETDLTHDLIRHKKTKHLADVSKLRGFLNSPAMITCLDMPWAPLFIGLIFFIHPMLGWITLIGASVMLLIAICAEKLTRANFISSRQTDIQLGQFTNHLSHQEHSEGQAASFPGLVDKWKNKYHSASITKTALLDSVQLSAAAGRFLRLALQIALISGAAVLVISGQLTAGGMIASSIIAARALGPFERAQDAWRSIIDAGASLKRLSHLEFKTDDLNIGFPVAESPTLEVEGLAFISPQSSRPLFSNLSLELHGGEMLGISGATGSGKTALAKLMVGQAQPTQGRIRLDKQDVSQRSKTDLHNDVFFLSQSSRLVPGTVVENISLFAESQIEDVVEATRKADVEDAILDLEYGFETHIEPDDLHISSGLVQRLLLARAYYQKPRLLVLDEPYSHLDNSGVASLLATLSELRDDGCAIAVISQRPSILAQCDKVLIMQNGQARLAERRKKAELTLLDSSSPDIPKDKVMEAAQ